MSKRRITVTFELEVPEGEEIPSGEDLATYLATFLQPSSPDDDDPYNLSNPTVFMDAPCVIANITGGVLQGASCEIPLEIIALDYDEEGLMVPQSDGSYSEAAVGNEMAVVDPGFVATVREAWMSEDEEE